LAERDGRFVKFGEGAGVDVRGQDLEVSLSDMKDRVLKGRTTAEKEAKVFSYGARKGQANEKYQGRYNLNWAQWMDKDSGPAPVLQTTTRKLQEADEASGSNGSGGARPMAHAGTTAPAPPPPPSPSARAPMPRTGQR